MKKSLLSLLVAFLLSPPAFAQMHGMDMMGHGEGYGHMEMGGMDLMAENMGACLENAEKIGLSASQITKLNPLHREMKKSQIRFQADLKLAQMEQMETMEVKDFDLGKASALVKKIADIKTAHHLEMLKTMKEVRALLTDDQFKKLKEMKPMKHDHKKSEKSMKHNH